MTVAIAVTAAAVIAILVLALVHHDAMRNGYKISASFSIARQFPPKDRAAAAGKPAALTGVPDRDTGSAA